MSTETDIYGMTAEDRAAFEAWDPKTTPWSFERGALSGQYVVQSIHHRALAWAACAKLYRERIGHAEAKLGKLAWEVERLNSQANELQAFARGRDDEATKLQIGNNALLARIKELEAAAMEAAGLWHENQELRARIKELEGLDLETLEKENVIWFQRVKELEAEIERLRSAL